MERRGKVSDRIGAEGLPLVAAFVVNETPAFEELLRGLAEASAQGRPSPDQRLTRREREVLRWVAGGLTRAGVAKRLGVKPATVHTLLKRAFRRLNAQSSAEAVAIAQRRGELELPP